jgi:hypothetical protein
VSALRIARPGEPVRLVPLDTPDPELALTMPQRRLMHLLRMYGWNQTRVARHLGIHTVTVQSSVRRIRAAGVAVPGLRGGAARGPDLRPRKGLPVACGVPLVRSGEPCARGTGHVGGHRSLRGELLMRANARRAA